MKRLLTSLVVLLSSLLTTFAQYSGSGNGTKGDPYRRNSLCVFFITDVGDIDNSAMRNVDFACQN